MKKLLATLIMSFAFLSSNVYGEDSPKEDSPKPCVIVCDDKFEACAGDIINLPEPRTVEEQQKIDECDKIKNDCLHDCAGQ